MTTLKRADGFTLVEVLVSTAIMLLVLGTTMTTVKNSLMVNESAALVSDSNQNLRAGTNMLVRDLMQAGRGIPTGGISIPSGAGATAINRPSPPGLAYTFENTTATALPAIITGADIGPSVDNQTTDVITMLMTDSTITELQLFPQGTAGQPTIQNNGSAFNVGVNTAWLAGDPLNGVSPIKTGDLIYFNNSNGTTIQTVTSVDATNVFFAATDWFNFNQPGAAAGSITQILPNPTTNASRVLMLTYYVDVVTTLGAPRLTRAVNHFGGQAMAGVVEDLDLSFDLVDGTNNPTQVKSLPYTVNGVTYSPNQIRKVNLHVGVRSEERSSLQNDYLRNHLSTVISIRSLAFVDRYK